MRKSLAMVATLLAISPLARAADPDLYVGAGVFRMTDKGDQASAIHPIALGARFGAEIPPYLAVEARYAGGIKTDSGSASGFTYDLDLNYLFGGYAKFIVPLRYASPYLLAGYTRGKETATIRMFGLSQSAIEGGFSWGAGVDVPINKTVWLGAEWARLIKGTDAQGVGFRIEEISIGLAVRF